MWLFQTFLLCLVSSVFGGPSNWTPIGSSKGGDPPGGRFNNAAAYCPDLDIMIMFGGDNANFVDTNDLWEFNFQHNSWTQLFPSVLPPPMEGMTMTTISTATEPCQIVLFGGFDDEIPQDFSEAWLIQFPSGSITFTPLVVPFAPPARSYHQAVNRKGTVAIMGGTKSTSTSVDFADLWILTLGAATGNNTFAPSSWVQVQYNSSIVISPRFQHAMGYFESLDELVVFAGRQWNSDQALDFSILSDLWTFSFASSTWKQATGLAISRAAHNGFVVRDSFYSFGGADVVVSGGVTQTYASNAIIQTDLSLGSQGPICIDSQDNIGLWCTVLTLVEPQVRYSFASVIRKDAMYVYGGFFNSILSDFWMINLTLASGDIEVTTSQNLSNVTLASTMYFMIAILSMMIICFVVFVVSLRRQRQGQANPLFQAMMIVRPKALGARQSVISALPLKTYRKTVESEQRKSRRISRKESVKSIRSIKSEKREAEEVDEDVESQAPPLDKPVKLANGADLPEITQDDLHDLCAICLTEYEDGEQLRVLPCEHFFHPECVDQWLRTHNACPMCKGAVDPDPERSEEPNAGQIVAAGTEADNPAFAGQNIETIQEETIARRSMTTSIINDETRQRLGSRDGESRIAESRGGARPSRAESAFVEMNLAEPEVAQEREEPRFTFGRISQSLPGIRLSSQTTTRPEEREQAANELNVTVHDDNKPELV
jgi:hypothetical protein